MFNELKKLLRHSAVYGAGEMISKIVGFALIPLYTNYLTPAEYGTLELLDLTTYVLGMLLGMGISQSVLRFYYEYDDESERKAIIFTCLFFSGIISFFVLTVLALFSQDISFLIFKNGEYASFLKIVFVTLCLNLINETPMAFIRILEKSTLYSVLSVSRLIIGLSLNILFVVGLRMGVLGILLSSLITNGIASLFLNSYTIKKVGVQWSWTKLKQILAYGLPYIPGGISMFILNFSDRFFLQTYGTLTDVGIYSLGYKFGMILNVLVLSPFMQAWGPKRFEIAKTSAAKSVFSVVFTYFLFVEIFCALGIAVLIPDVLKIMSPREYWAADAIVPIILLSYILLGSYFQIQIGMLIEKKTNYIAAITLLSAVVNILLNIVLIPLMGTLGAAFSTLISFFVMHALAFIISNKMYFIQYESRRIFKMLVISSILYLTSKSISIQEPLWSIILNILIAMSFPFLLYLVKFYSIEEIKKTREGVSRVAALVFQPKNRPPLVSATPGSKPTMSSRG